MAPAGASLLLVLVAIGVLIMELRHCYVAFLLSLAASFPPACELELSIMLFANIMLVF